MKNIHPHRLAGLLPALAALFLFTVAPLRAADQNPPGQLSYQGFLSDNSGVPLGNTAPENYAVEFRIYDAATGGNPLWGEGQTVTVDKGYFSVMLGQGAEITGVDFASDLSGLFTGASASDRYIGITITTLNSGSELSPRVRLLASPYAMLSRFANAVVNASGTAMIVTSGQSVGVNTVTPQATLDVNGTVKATTFSGNGAGLTGIVPSGISGTLATSQIPSLSASKITSGALNSARIPGLNASKIANGTFNDARLSSNVPLKNQNNTFTGNITVNSPNTISGNGTIPIGGIIMWSGSNIPSGWALCDGNNGTPNLKNRFIVSSSGGGYAVGDTGGNNFVTLTTANLPAHKHSYKDTVFTENSSVRDDKNTSGYGEQFVSSGIGSSATDTDNNMLFYKNRNTDSAGSGDSFDNRPLYYALAFIMRVE